MNKLGKGQGLLDYRGDIHPMTCFPSSENGVSAFIKRRYAIKYHVR